MIPALRQRAKVQHTTRMKFPRASWIVGISKPDVAATMVGEVEVIAAEAAFAPQRDLYARGAVDVGAVRAFKQFGTDDPMSSRHAGYFTSWPMMPRASWNGGVGRVAIHDWGSPTTSRKRRIWAGNVYPSAAFSARVDALS